MRGRSSRGVGLAALAWLVAELSGCGSEVGGALGEGDFASEFAHGVCTNMGSCCASAGFPHQAASCETTAREYFESYLARRRTQAVDYDAEAAAKCLDAVSSGLRSCTKLDNSECEKMFKGRQSPGQACAASDECGDRDGERAHCDNGVCVVYERRVGSGAPCVGTCTTSQDCSSSSDGTGYCYTNDGFSCGAEGRCVPVPGIGESCAFATVCKEGAYCDFDSSECQPKKADGAACVVGDECASSSCNGGTCRLDVPVDADFCAGRFGD